jgi:hypothetical protein
MGQKSMIVNILRTNASQAASGVEQQPKPLNSKQPTIAWALPLGVGLAAGGLGVFTATRGAATLSKNLLSAGIVVGGAVSAGLIYNALKVHTYQVSLAQTPDYSEVLAMPEGPERQQAAYDVLTKHWEENSRCINGALTKWKEDGLVQDFSAHPIGNSFVVSVAGWKKGDFLEKMRQVDGTGDIVDASDI